MLQGDQDFATRPGGVGGLSSQGHGGSGAVVHPAVALELGLYVSVFSRLGVNIFSDPSRMFHRDLTRLVSTIDIDISRTRGRACTASAHGGAPCPEAEMVEMEQCLERPCPGRIR